MEMTKREGRAARAFDYSRPAMKHDVRFLSFLGRGWCVGWGCVAVLLFVGSRRGGVKNKETRGGRTPHTTGPRRVSEDRTENRHTRTARARAERRQLSLD